MNTMTKNYRSCTGLTADERAALDALVVGGLLPADAMGSGSFDAVDELQRQLDDRVGVVIQGRHVVAVR